MVLLVWFRLVRLRDFVYDAYARRGISHVQEAPKYTAMISMLMSADTTHEMTESDFWSIIFETVPELLFYTPEAQEPAPNLDDFTENLASSLRSLPRRYSVLISLPGLRAVGDFRFAIAPGISMFVSDDPWKDAPRGLLSEPPSGPLSPLNRKVYLGCELEGYFPRFTSQNSLLDRAWAVLRQLAYLLISTNTWAMYGYRPGRTADAHVVDESGRQYLVELPPGLKQVATALGPIGEAVFDEHGASDLFVGLKTAQVFYSKAGNRDHDRIAASMEWLIDSQFATDQTLAYIAACIGIESLIGDDKNELLTVRLEDRYSHLLGLTRSQRAALAQDMRSVFQIRGQLVHARAQRLKGRDLANLHKAQAMLQACLQKELPAFLEHG